QFRLPPDTLLPIDLPPGRYHASIRYPSGDVERLGPVDHVVGLQTVIDVLALGVFREFHFVHVDDESRRALGYGTAVPQGSEKTMEPASIHVFRLACPIIVDTNSFEYTTSRQDENGKCLGMTMDARPWEDQLGYIDDMD